MATGKGLGNVLKMDREIWVEFGNNPKLTKEMVDLIRSGINVVEVLRKK